MDETSLQTKVGDRKFNAQVNRPVFDICQLAAYGRSLSGSCRLALSVERAHGLSVEYRYFVAESPTWYADITSGAGGNALMFGGSQTHAFSLAFEYTF